jgi:hypothetical protein
MDIIDAYGDVFDVGSVLRVSHRSGSQQAKGEGRMEKGEGRREKGEGRREKGEGRRDGSMWS